MRLTDAKKAQIMADYESGKYTVKAILAKNKIAKATFYSVKKAFDAPDPKADPEPEPKQATFEEESDDESIIEAPKPSVRSKTFTVDPMEGIQQLNPTEFPDEDFAPEYEAEPAYQDQEMEQRLDQTLPPNIHNSYNPGQDIDPFNLDVDQDISFDNVMNEFNLYDPQNMVNAIHDSKNKPKDEHGKIPKSMYDPKKVFKEDLKEEKRVTDAEEKQKHIYTIRKYIYAFKDNLGLQSIVGKTHVHREKFVYVLFNKSLNELRKIESMIKYHVRAELSGTSQVFETIVLVGVKLVETIGSRTGLRFEGLTSEVQQEINEKGQMYVLLQEIGIEMGVDAYTSPKKELAFKLGMKLMELDSKNRMIERHMGSRTQPSSTNVATKLQNSFNENLSSKYDDL